MVVNYKGGSFGLHKSTIGFTYGWPRNGEIGMSLSLDEITPFTPFSWKTLEKRAGSVNIYGKYLLAQLVNQSMNLAAGWWNHTYYIVGGLQLIERVRLEGGGSLKRKEDHTNRFGHFMALTHTLKYHCIILDYDSQIKETGLGWRCLLSPSIKFDIMWVDIGGSRGFFDDFMFGITISG